MRKSVEISVDFSVLRLQPRKSQQLRRRKPKLRPSKDSGNLQQRNPVLKLNLQFSVRNPLPIPLVAATRRQVNKLSQASTNRQTQLVGLQELRLLEPVPLPTLLQEGKSSSRHKLWHSLQLPPLGFLPLDRLISPVLQLSQLLQLSELSKDLQGLLRLQELLSRHLVLPCSQEGAEV